MKNDSHLAVCTVALLSWLQEALECYFSVYNLLILSHPIANMAGGPGLWVVLAQNECELNKDIGQTDGLGMRSGSLSK